MHIEMLKTIAQEAQGRVRHVYELYDLGEPPSVTPGIVEAVLAAAARQPVPEPTPSYYIQRGWEPPVAAATPHPPQPQSKIVLAPSDDLESAVIARLRELATDGIMPTQRFFDARRGDLPNAALLYENWGRRHWAEWAELAGLAYAGPRNSGKRKARKTEAAPASEATFRDAQVSERTASVLGPEHVVVSPHGSERNGAPASD